MKEQLQGVEVESLVKKIEELEAQIAKQKRYEDTMFIACNKIKGRMRLAYRSLVDHKYQGKQVEGLLTMLRREAEAGNTMLTVRAFTYSDKDSNECIGIGLKCWKS